MDDGGTGWAPGRLRADVRKARVWKEEQGVPGIGADGEGWRGDPRPGLGLGAVVLLQLARAEHPLCAWPRVSSQWTARAHGGGAAVTPQGQRGRPVAGALSGRAQVLTVAPPRPPPLSPSGRNRLPLLLPSRDFSARIKPFKGHVLRVPIGPSIPPPSTSQISRSPIEFPSPASRFGARAPVRARPGLRCGTRRTGDRPLPDITAEQRLCRSRVPRDPF